MKGLLRREIDKENIWIFLLIILVGSLFSAMTPPLQSPDERDHIKRAYLLSKGQILLKTPPGGASGGEIDTGLIAYFRGFQDLPHHPGKKLSKEEENAVSDIEWTGIRVFSPAPGTGYYFPLAYAPQALGLLIGETLGLTINDSYWLARFLVLAFSALLITLAFSITPANVFVLGMLIIPMSIFQFSSASLDAFTTALMLFCVALFMRGGDRKTDLPAWMIYLLAGCIFVLVASRIHLLPLLGLIFVLWILRRRMEILWVFFVVTALSFLWIYLSINNTTDNSAAVARHSTAQYFSFYIQNPGLLYEILVNTISRNYGYYKNSLIGILGWLDAPFGQRFYDVITNCLFFLAVFSISIKGLRDEWRARLALMMLSLVSIFLIFFALLVSWNPLPTKIIEGVQGRYFIGPLMIMGYALSGGSGSLDNKWGRLGVVPLVIMSFMVATGMPRILIERYYMPTHEIADVRLQIKPGAQIKPATPYVLPMIELHKNEAAMLQRMGIMFWLKDKPVLGEAELKLKGPDSVEFAKRFSLSNLTNSDYYYFDLDSRRYTYGEISIISGTGVSVWESRGGNGVSACIVYEYTNGKRRFTPGCPIY